MPGMSWRTTLAGLLAGLSALAALPDVPPWLRTIAIVVGAVAVAMSGVLSRDAAARTADPPNPDRAPVGPSVDVLERVRRGELSPEEGARALEVGRERGVVAPAFGPPNARGDK